MKTIFNPVYVKLINTLKQCRLERGFTQAHVAHRLGRSRTWVGKVEQCERRLDVIEVRDLCGLYGIDFHEVTAELAEKEDP
ncbi:MAG: helix-turn-helix domain-containing protein [Kiritimatiellae bacterium]|nr:helix-turn-helix domain-containing protein [Kiritimatiellia bacterium]